jgi:hypothetical protein
MRIKGLLIMTYLSLTGKLWSTNCTPSGSGSAAGSRISILLLLPPPSVAHFFSQFFNCKQALDTDQSQN